MSYDNGPGRLATWLHRRGIARRVSSTYGSGRGWCRCTVDTALPLSVLAGVANRWETPRLIGRERVGRWQWRWTFGKVA